MASIKEAYDNTIGENFTGLKLLLWAIPLTYFKDLIEPEQVDIIQYIIVGVFYILLLGFVTESANNAVVKKPVIIPGLNLISMEFNGIKTIIALSLYILFPCWAASFACSFVKLESPVFVMTIDIMIWLFFISIPVALYVLFIRKLNVFEAFNVKKILQILGDTFIMFSYLVIKLLLLTGLIIGFISYMFWLFVGLDNSLIQYIWSIAIMYNLVIGANYLAQFSEEMELQYRDTQTEGVKLY